MARACRSVRRRPAADRIPGRDGRARRARPDAWHRQAVGDHACARRTASPAAAAVRRRNLGTRRSETGIRTRGAGGASVIPQQVERRARWVLDSIGARDLAIGDGMPYHPEAWGAIERGERPEGDAVAEAFYDLARVE